MLRWSMILPLCWGNNEKVFSCPSRPSTRSSRTRRHPLEKKLEVPRVHDQGVRRAGPHHRLIVPTRSGHHGILRCQSLHCLAILVNITPCMLPHSLCPPPPPTPDPPSPSPTPPSRKPKARIDIQPATRECFNLSRAHTPPGSGRSISTSTPSDERRRKLPGHSRKRRPGRTPWLCGWTRSWA